MGDGADAGVAWSCTVGAAGRGQAAGVVRSAIYAASVASRRMRLALAANGASGGGLDPEPLAAAMRRGGAEVVIAGCDSEDLERLAASGPDRIAVAGGDGTIGPVADAAGRLGVPLAVIPTGTANDFARAHGLP